MNIFQQYASSVGLDLIKACAEGKINAEDVGLSPALNEVYKDPSFVALFLSTGKITLEEAKPILLMRAEENLDFVVKYFCNGWLTKDELKCAIEKHTSSNPFSLFFFLESKIIDFNDSVKKDLLDILNKKPEFVDMFLRKGWITEEDHKQFLLDNFPDGAFMDGLIGF